MPLVAAVLVLMGLGYAGNSLVMIASAAGIAVALFVTRRGSLRQQATGVLLGALGAALLAELVHLGYHSMQAVQPDHGGFWLSALLVGLINAVGILPAVWFVDRRAGRAKQTAGENGVD